MSAKDDFFKKVTENKERQEATKVQIASDTLRFTNAMHHLIQQIEAWLHKSGIDVVVTENEHHDESIMMYSGGEKLSTYRVKSCHMKNGVKKASLIPIAVYGGQKRGWASLSIDNPNRAPRNQKYLLSLSSDDVWIIKQDIVSPRAQQDNGAELTEESFFQALESLA